MDFVRPSEVFHYVKERQAGRFKTVISNHNLHSLALMRKSAKVRHFYETADLVQVDSVPAIMWARILGHNVRNFHRCTYLDWRAEFWAEATSARWRVFYLGCRPHDIDAAVDAVKTAHPELELRGRHGYFDATTNSDENRAVLEEITQYNPDILMVGMGMPRQEIWIYENINALPKCAIFTVGGAFDYEAGVQSPAPRWVAALGLEWLFRLANDPTRLFERYCIEPFGLVPAIIDDLKQWARRQNDCS